MRAQTSRDSADPGGGQTSLDCRLSQSARALRGADVGPGRRSRDSGAAQAHKAPGPSAGAVRSTPRICRSAGAEVSTTMCRSEGAGGEGGGEGGGGGVPCRGSGREASCRSLRRPHPAPGSHGEWQSRRWQSRRRQSRRWQDPSAAPASRAGQSRWATPGLAGRGMQDEFGLWITDMDT